MFYHFLGSCSQSPSLLELRSIYSLVISPYRLNEHALDVVSVHILSSIVRIFGKRCEHLSSALIALPKKVLRIIQRKQQLRSLYITCEHRRRTSKDFENHSQTHYPILCTI